MLSAEGPEGQPTKLTGNIQQVGDAIGAEVIYQPSRKLRPLLERLGEFPLWYPEASACPSVEHIFAIGDLPLLSGMRSDADILPSLSLGAAPLELARYCSELQALPRPWVGITWQAGCIGVPSRAVGQ